MVCVESCERLKQKWTDRANVVRLIVSKCVILQQPYGAKCKMCNIWIWNLPYYPVAAGTAWCLTFLYWSPSLTCKPDSTRNTASAITASLRRTSRVNTPRTSCGHMHCSFWTWKGKVYIQGNYRDRKDNTQIEEALSAPILRYNIC